MKFLKNLIAGLSIGAVIAESSSSAVISEGFWYDASQGFRTANLKQYVIKVEKGDNLSKIANELRKYDHFNDETTWQKLYIQNVERIDVNPNLLNPGQYLKYQIKLWEY